MQTSNLLKLLLCRTHLLNRLPGSWLG